MPELSRKQKKALVAAAVTCGVYLSFKYLLPLFLPFAAAYLIALFLRPTAAWLERRLRFRAFGRQFGVPIGVIGGAELLLMTALLGAAVFCGGRKLFEEANRIVNEVPGWIAGFDEWLSAMCRSVEIFCRLRDGVLVQAARETLLTAAEAFKRVTMSNLAVNSVAAFSFCAQVFVVAAVFFIASVLSLQEMDELRQKRRRSLFSREIALLGRRLATTGNAWLKTQLIIMIATSCLCILGFSIIGNPYSILLGTGVGLLDALPLFGTGTVLIPWSLFALIQGQWYEGAVTGVLFLICCLMREFLEARLMGGKMGLSPLETLAAIYVGLRLFGILGMILGPIGLLIIEDLVEEYAGDGREDGRGEEDSREEKRRERKHQEEKRREGKC